MLRRQCGASTAPATALDNNIIGNDGNNILNGGGGDDYLNGGFGADTMIGGTGDDNYFVDNAVDVVTENADEGQRHGLGRPSATRSAPPREPDLWLEGSAAINGTGNDLDNDIYGNDSSNTLIGGGGDDLLEGGGGTDTMIGGIGDDDYYVDNAGDVVTENANQGTDTVFASDQLHTRRPCGESQPRLQCRRDQRHRQRPRQQPLGQLRAPTFSMAAAAPTTCPALTATTSTKSTMSATRWPRASDKRHRLGLVGGQLRARRECRAPDPVHQRRRRRHRQQSGQLYHRHLRQERSARRRRQRLPLWLRRRRHHRWR